VRLDRGQDLGGGGNFQEEGGTRTKKSRTFNCKKNERTPSAGRRKKRRFKLTRRLNSVPLKRKEALGKNTTAKKQPPANTNKQKKRPLLGKEDETGKEKKNNAPHDAPEEKSSMTRDAGYKTSQTQKKEGEEVSLQRRENGTGPPSKKKGNHEGNGLAKANSNGRVKKKGKGQNSSRREKDLHRVDTNWREGGQTNMDNGRLWGEEQRSGIAEGERKGGGIVRLVQGMGDKRGK